MPQPSDPWARPGPDPGRRPGRVRGWVFALGVVSALVLTGLVATVVVLTTRTAATSAPVAAPSVARTTVTRPVPAPGSATPPTPSTSPTTPTPSASPTASPSPQATVDTSVAASTSPTAAPPEPLPTSSAPPSTAPGPDRSLRTNTLYGVDLGRASVACDLTVRRPKPPLADARLQAYLTEVVDCLTQVFDAPLADHGFTLVEPLVKTFHQRVESPCGTFNQSGSPAYYCSTTRTIYWPDTVDDGREAYTFARLGYVGLTAHEFGHHLQATTGMLSAYATAYEGATKEGRYALSRRLELQAQCFEGVFLHVTRSALDVTAKDRAELRSWHGYTGDEDPPKSRKPDHGSSRAQYAWLARGLGSGDFADCNTWTASSKSVT